MVLKNLENRLERIFERSLSKPFKSALQPVEIGQRIVREVDLGRRVSTSGLVAPNHIKLWLSADDAARFSGFQKALINELAETVRQHSLTEGYNFVGPVSIEVFIDDDLALGQMEAVAEFQDGASEPRVIASDGRTYIIGDRPLIIGRTSDCDIMINEGSVSRRHAEIWKTAEGVAVRDLQSTNGTVVNGHRITAVSLSPRDEIEIGTLRLRIELA
jgi:hypothetical protein